MSQVGARGPEAVVWPKLALSERAPASTISPWRSFLVHLGLVAYLAAVKVALTLLPVRFPHPSQAESLSWPGIGLVAAAGLLGAWLTGRAGIPSMLDPRVSARARFFLPALAGALLGIVGIVVDQATGLSDVLARSLGVSSIHLDFPLSVFFYAAGAILICTLYYLLPIPLLVWLVSGVVLRGRYPAQVLWAVALLVLLVEPASQAAVLAGRPDLLVPVALFVFVAGGAQVYAFVRAGFLAALSLRLALYAVWHVVWPVVVL